MMQTVREQLEQALHDILEANAQVWKDGDNADEAAFNEAIASGEAALDRARAEPEGHVSRQREDLLLALGDLFEADYRSIPDDVWVIARTRFEKSRNELMCPDLCDTSCRCYQEGLEAQRERVG